jgi:alanine dehydrogenase
VVCCCTDTREPITRYEWFDPGTHVTSVGGTFGPEIDPETVRKARVFVEWKGAAENPPPAGAHELQGRDPATITEVGAVIAGLQPGRQNDAEITLYKSTGSGFEDAVVARVVYEAAVAARVGTDVAL